MKGDDMTVPKIQYGTARSVKEWIGKTPDSKAPPRVRLRVFDAHGGICHISGRKIRAGDAWELEHVVRLKDGGENRESNLAPALVNFHKEKTADENKQQAKEDRIRKKHLGIWQSKSPKIQSRPFNR